jgi:hypothetical protein
MFLMVRTNLQKMEVLVHWRPFVRFCCTRVRGLWFSLKSRLLLCFALLPWCFMFVFFLVGGGGLGRGHLMIVYSSGPKLLCFFTGSILTKWDVHCCCCFEARHQTRGLTSHGQLPPSQAGGFREEFQTSAHQWDSNPEPLLVPGGSKMDYTNEPSPLRNLIYHYFWLLTT